MAYKKPDLFILYPVKSPFSDQPFFDGEFFLAEKHMMEVVGVINIKMHGKEVQVEQTRCVDFHLVKVRPEEVHTKTYKLWGVQQRL